MLWSGSSGRSPVGAIVGTTRTRSRPAVLRGPSAAWLRSFPPLRYWRAPIRGRPTQCRERGPAVRQDGRPEAPTIMDRPDGPRCPCRKLKPAHIDIDGAIRPEWRKRTRSACKGRSSPRASTDSRALTSRLWFPVGTLGGSAKLAKLMIYRKYQHIVGAPRSTKMGNTRSPWRE